MVKETQKRGAEIPTAPQGGGGRNLPRPCEGASNAMARRDVSCQGTEDMMQAVVERKNMRRAYARVVGNKGSAGIDNMSVDELKAYVTEHWARIKEELLEGRYRPEPVLRVEIPKPTGGTRKLGVPTVMDRLIQQAVLKAQEYVAEGKRWVIDIDIEKFFD